VNASEVGVHPYAWYPDTACGNIIARVRHRLFIPENLPEGEVSIQDLQRRNNSSSLQAALEHWKTSASKRRKCNIVSNPEGGTYVYFPPINIIVGHPPTIIP